MLDSSNFKTRALDSLLDIIDSIHGNKVLVLDKALSTSLSITTSFSTLKEHGIKQVVWLQSVSLDSVAEWKNFNALIYMSSTDFRCSSIIADHAQSVLSATSTLDVHLVLAPEKTLEFTQALEEKSVLGDVTVHSWPVHFLPLDPDLLSLNITSGGFNDTYVDDLTSSVYLAAEAFQDLQNRYGLIGRITGKGEAAHKLAELLLRNRQARRTDIADTDNGESGNSFDHKFSNVFVGTSIDQLVVVDRQTDPLTPLLTQLTYLGLIDEFYSVGDLGQVELPAAIVHTSQPKDGGASSGSNLNTGLKTAQLATGQDSLFKTIKDSNFARVGPSLNKVARQLQSDYEQRHEAQTVSQIKEFVAKLGGLQTVHMSLGFHTALVQDVMEKVNDEEFNKWLEIQQNLVAGSMDLNTIHSMIDDLIGRSSSLSMVLRLLSIESLCNGGIKHKDLQHFKKEVLQTYGYQHLLTFNRLERLGLVYARTPQLPNYFPSLRKLLSLITDQEDDPDEPRDISFTYSGYAPLSVRLVQCVVDKGSVLKPRRFQNENQANLTGWRGAEEILKNVPGPSFDEIQRSEGESREGKLRKILTRNSPGHDQTTTIVFYLGGITYAEIAALRYIASKPSCKTNIIIATTGLINGNKITDV